MKRNLLILFTFPLFTPLPAADNYIDLQGYADGKSVRLKSTDAAGVHVPHVIVDSSGGSTTSVTSSASLTATATNANATVTLGAAGSGIKNVVDGITWSYSGGTPTPGRITISDGATVVFDEDITSAGAGFFPVRRKGTANTAMTITIYVGGTGIVGKINVGNAWTE